MAYLWGKILRVTLKPGEYEIFQVRTWEERSTNSRCCSAQRISSVHTNAVSVHTNKIWILGNRELRMVQTILETCLSETLASGTRKVWIKDLSPQAMLIPDAKTTMEKEWKKVVKKALKKDKESPFCRIGGHPLIQKFVYTLWESSKEQYYFFTWEIILGSMNLYVKICCYWWFSHRKTVIEKLTSRGRSIISLPKSSWERSTKKEYILRLWPIRLQEDFKNYHPVQVPSLNISERLIWILTLRGWWITVQRLRKKEENFDNLCFESAKPTVEYHESGSQDSNNFETKVKPSSMYRETVSSIKQEIPGLLESGSGNSSSSNPSFKHPRTKSISIKKDIHQEERIWDYNFWMTDVQKTLRWYSHLQVRMVRHHGESNRNGVDTLFWQEDSW